MIKMESKPMNIIDIKTEFENSLVNLDYNANVHASRIAICGYEYYQNKGKTKIIPEDAYARIERGIRTENILSDVISKMRPDYVHDYEVVFNTDGQRIVGHLDFYSKEANHIIELKTTQYFSGEYFPVYWRQLNAYMYIIGAPVTGSLWIYDFGKTQWRQFDFTTIDKDSFEKNLKAYMTGQYIDGIESAECKYCSFSSTCLGGKKYLGSVIQ